MKNLKICAVICEYNPFHNGHAYQLQQIRKISGCDYILCLMSGNFTQRGEAAILNKFIRAKHAILGGADAVLELPTPFACASAELFASGAISILSSIPNVTTLAFGCESGNAEDFLATAKATLREDKQFKELLKQNLKAGASFAKARTDATLALNEDVDESLLTAPNNILGVEYCRAILRQNAKIIPLAIARKGAGYADTTPHVNFSSATALRACMSEKTRKCQKALKNNLPKYSYRDCKHFAPFPYEKAALVALLSTTKEKLKKQPDCTEGLENKLFALAASNASLDEIIRKTVTKRYTLSRIKRILAGNLLGLNGAQTREFLTSPLYCNLLAVKKQGAEEILSALGEGKFPLLVRKSDTTSLKKEALECFEIDVRANRIYNALTGVHENDYQTLFVE